MVEGLCVVIIFGGRHRGRGASPEQGYGDLRIAEHRSIRVDRRSRVGQLVRESISL